MRSRYLGALVLILCAVLVCLSTLLAIRKQKSLGYHTRDYTYYAQFQAKLLDGGRSPRLSLNPYGRNLFGFRGVEGSTGLHQAIHFEPIKYLQAVVYALSGGPLGVYLFNALVFFSPALYLIFRMPQRSAWDRQFYGLAAGIYLLYPSSQLCATFDLRPFLFLLPFFFLCVLAVHARRSKLEAVALFNLPFLAREEALVLAPIAILYAYAKTQQEPSAGDRALLRPLVASYLAWLLASMAFFFWTGYPNSGTVWGVLLLLALASGAGAAGIATAARRLGPASEWLPPLVLSLAAIPLAYRAEDLGAERLLFDPRYTLCAGWALLVIVAAWPAIRGPRGRKGVLAGLTALLLLLLAANLEPEGRSALAAHRVHAARAADAAIVFDLRRSLDPASSAVLADYTTHQAFFDFESVYALERLPWYLSPGDSRFFPENAGMLRRLIREKIEVIAVSTANLGRVTEEVAAVGLEGSLQEIAANEHYAILRVARTPR